MVNFNDLFEGPLLAPLFMIVPALVMVMLLALTMRSIIMRERAVIRDRRNDPQARAAYEAQWRDRPAA